MATLARANSRMDGEQDRVHNGARPLLDHLRCAAVEVIKDLPSPPDTATAIATAHHQPLNNNTIISNHHHHFHHYDDEDEYDPHEEPGLEIIDEEEEEEEWREPYSSSSPSSSSSSSPATGESGSLPAVRHRGDGAEEIVRNALFLLALKHPSLKHLQHQAASPHVRPPPSSAAPPPPPPPASSSSPCSERDHLHPHHNPHHHQHQQQRRLQPGGSDEPVQALPDGSRREEQAVPPLPAQGTEDEAGRSLPGGLQRGRGAGGRATPPPSSSAAAAAADKRARREEAKRVYREQRRMRRRERRRLHEQQKLRPQEEAEEGDRQQQDEDGSLRSDPSPLVHCPSPPLLRAPATLGAGAAANGVPTSSAPVRKRKRLTTTNNNNNPNNSDDGEATSATSYDEAADDDVEIDEEEDGDALLLCEEEEEEEDEILDSGRAGSAAQNRKRKRPVERKRATADQVVVLEKMYNEDKFPSSELIRHTGERLGMKPSKVKNWFQNKRAKERRVAAGKERPSSAAAKAKKAAAAAAANAKKPPCLQRDRKPRVEGKAKEAKGQVSTTAITANPDGINSVPMDVDEPASREGFSSTLPFSFLSARRKLALPSTAPPKKRYTSSSSFAHGPLRPSPAMVLPPLVGSSPTSLHFLSSPLPPTLPGAPHLCQRQ